MGKKLPEDLAALLKREDVNGRPVRLMFQDETRFGRMVRIRRWWSPFPSRPVVDNGYERQFVYVYGAVSPIQGELDWMISKEMNTLRMNEFLAQVSHAHSNEFIVMIVDGASSHRSVELEVPKNIRLHRLPGYSPELNPQEHVWDELREKEFPNRVFESMEGVLAQLQSGLPRLAANNAALRRIFPRNRNGWLHLTIRIIFEFFQMAVSFLCAHWPFVREARLVMLFPPFRGVLYRCYLAPESSGCMCFLYEHLPCGWIPVHLYPLTVISNSAQHVSNSRCTSNASITTTGQS